jgi:hypothetical protein
MIEYFWTFQGSQHLHLQGQALTALYTYEDITFSLNYPLFSLIVTMNHIPKPALHQEYGTIPYQEHTIKTMQPNIT